MNNFQLFIIKLLGLDMVLENHVKAIQELANAHNQSVAEYSKLNLYVNDRFNIVQDNVQLLSNSLPKSKTKKASKTKAKVAKKVIHKKTKKTLA